MGPTLEVVGGVVHECEPGNTSCAMDVNGHGTHIAGTIGGYWYGVAKNVTIHAVKVVNDDGTGMVSWLAKAVKWVLLNAPKPAIISASLSGHYNSQTAGKYAALLQRAGVTVIVAA